MYRTRCIRVLWLIGLLAAAPSRVMARVESCPPPRTLKKCGELGERYFHSGQYDLAMKAFQQAYVIKPIPLLLYNIGQAQRLSGQTEAALRSFERYLEADPGTKLRAEVEGYLALSRHNTVEPAEATKPPADAERLRKQQEQERQAAALRQQQEEQQQAALRRQQEQERQAAALRQQQEREQAARVAVQPRLVLVATVSPEPARRPIYKRWWFWTTLTAVAVGGITAGVVAATYHPASSFPMGLKVYDAN